MRGMYWKWKQNYAKPGVFFGSFLVFLNMNREHVPLWQFGLEHIDLPRTGRLLDVGCGGGGLMRMVHELAPQLHLTGVDYSPKSVAETLRVNRRAVRAGMLDAVEGSVSALPFADNTFDVVTSSESLYFWPCPGEDLKEIARVMKPGACLMICLDCCDPDRCPEAARRIRGMRVYTPAELVAFASGAGLQDAQCHLQQDSGRVCLVARR